MRLVWLLLSFRGRSGRGSVWAFWGGGGSPVEDEQQVELRGRQELHKGVSNCGAVLGWYTAEGGEGGNVE